MAVLPGSLDHLYYNGIIDHIPYEAYEQPRYVNKNIKTPYVNNSFQDPIVTEANKIKPKNSNKSRWIKGLIGLGAIVATAICLLKGKINPFNWFKK